MLAVREGAVPTRGIEGLTSPLVGRERELATLRSRIEELIARTWADSVAYRRGRAGKSRLVAELRKLAEFYTRPVA